MYIGTHMPEMPIPAGNKNGEADTIRGSRNFALLFGGFSGKELLKLFS